MQEQRPLTRAALAAAAAAMGLDRTDALSQLYPAPGKRPQQADVSKLQGAPGGSKKNRSALSDLTNRGQQQVARDEAAKAEPAGRPAHTVSAPAAEQQPDRNPFDCARQRTAAALHSRPISDRHSVDSFQSSAAHATATPVPTWVDIDAVSTLLGCPEYVVSIFEHLREAEKRRRPTPSYLETVQTDMNSSMRSILVDWMVEVCQEYRLVSDTLFLAVTYLDRYLSQVPVVRSRLQLVGVTCLMLAAKYEEIYAPQVEQFVYITDHTYTRDEVLAMEEHVLGVLDFELTVPTAKTFLRRFIQAAMAGSAQPDARLEHLAAYLVELALCEYGSLHFLPSHVAAAAVLVAQYSLGGRVWSPTLEHYTAYSPPDLQLPARMLHHLAAAAYRQEHPPASREKFSSARYKAVSLLRPPETLPSWLFDPLTTLS